MTEFVTLKIYLLIFFGLRKHLYDITTEETQIMFFTNTSSALLYSLSSPFEHNKIYCFNILPHHINIYYLKSKKFVSTLY